MRALEEYREQMGREEADIDLLQCALLIAKHARPRPGAAPPPLLNPGMKHRAAVVPAITPWVKCYDTKVLVASIGPYYIVAEDTSARHACQRLLSKYTNELAQTKVEGIATGNHVLLLVIQPTSLIASAPASQALTARQRWLLKCQFMAAGRGSLPKPDRAAGG